MDKAYDPKKYEDAIYKRWEASGFFAPEAHPPWADNPDKREPFSLMMPPPNVTGVLHLGHALENTLMDVMIRYQRMQGKKTLLLPGTDHAAVATQARVEDMLVKKGILNPREHFGREGLLAEIKNYAETSKQTILKQIKRMGTSADWSRLAYTFDEDRNKAVNEVFVRMYNDGLIYRGHRVVNWSVKGQSTCSDDELVYVERPGTLYYFRYSKDFPIPIATTRPETKLGDTAVAVHPKGKWKKYIGKEFDIQDFGQSGHTLTIKVIGDEGIDQELGTGALGVTIAHSPVDFDMYLKQKARGLDIGMRQVIGQDGNMTPEAGSEYQGLSVLEAREKVVAWLRAEGLLEKEEETVQNVGTSDRFKDVVEPIPMTQWFVDVNKEIPGRGKSLKDLMREAVATGHNGDPNQKVRITPDRFEKTYFQWIDHLRDWNISRQIWWGHRIPVWYRRTTDYGLRTTDIDDVYVGVEPPEGDDWVQDEDTLDTWFSSGLWTFSTLGWPQKTNDLKTFHPTSWMQMGYEILFFWMARMILMSTYALDQIPFRDVYIHGILRDKDGKKFSKSLGNGIDPIDIIEKYGTDALRFSLIAGIAPGNDARFYEEKVEGAKHLVNKIWNISRFVLDKVSDITINTENIEPKDFFDKAILYRFNELKDGIIKELGDYGYVSKGITGKLEIFQFSNAIQQLRAFTWITFADWYIEIVKGKNDPTKDKILVFVLKDLLKLWHPFLPFVTEAIWNNVDKKNLLMMERWPVPIKKHSKFKNEAEEFEKFLETIVNVRIVRSKYNIPYSKKINLYTELSFSSEEVGLLVKLAGIQSIKPIAEKSNFTIPVVVSNGEVFLEVMNAIDANKETARLKKEIAEVAPYVVSLEKKLKNKEFVQNAPEAVVLKEREKLRQAKEKLKKLEDQLV